MQQLGRQSLSRGPGARTTLDATEDIRPGDTFMYEYPFLVDAPRRLDWHFVVGGGVAAGAALSFWVEGHFTDGAGAARTRLLFPPGAERERSCARSTDHHAITRIDGSAVVQFWWRNDTAAPQRLDYSVRGKKLAAVAPQLETPMRTRVARELDQAVETFAELVAEDDAVLSE